MRVTVGLPDPTWNPKSKLTNCGQCGPEELASVGFSGSSPALGRFCGLRVSTQSLKA